jgi:transposase
VVKPRKAQPVGRLAEQPDAVWLMRSRLQYGIEVVGPVRPDISWQARAPERYDLSQFQIDWSTQSVTCPSGSDQRLLDTPPGPCARERPTPRDT